MSPEGREGVLAAGLQEACLVMAQSAVQAAKEWGCFLMAPTASTSESINRKDSWAGGARAPAGLGGGVSQTLEA